MPSLPTPKLPKRLAASLRLAEALASDERLIMAFHAAADDTRERERALTDPLKFLMERKIEVPPELQLQFVDIDFSGRPYPMGEFFSVVLTKCRTYWVRERDVDGKLGKWERVTVCFGLEIFPKAWPRGPAT